MHVNDVVIIEGIKRVPSDGFAKLTLAPVVASRKFLKRLFFLSFSLGEGWRERAEKGGAVGQGGRASWGEAKSKNKKIIIKLLMLC